LGCGKLVALYTHIPFYHLAAGMSQNGK
jgi:hypothetical protein